MKQVLTILVTLLFSSSIVFGQQMTDDFTGKWKTDEGQIVTIAKSGQKIIGVDYKNRECVYNVRFEKDKWKGTVEDHEKNRKADCEIYLQENKLKIVLHKGILSKTIFWTRVE